MSRNLEEEYALTQSVEEFQRMVQGIRDYAVFLLDPAGRVVSWNTGAELLKGYCAQEILGKHISQFYLPEERMVGKPEQTLAKAAAEGRCRDEGWRVRKDGSRFWASVTVTVVRTGTGELRGFIKVTQDLSERKRMEEALRESEHRLRQAVETAELGLYEREILTNRVTINEHLRRMVGLPPGEVDPDLAVKALHPEDRQRVLGLVARAFNAQLREVFGVEFRIVWPSGEVRWVSGRGRVVFDEAVQPLRPLKFVGVLRDITERKRAEEALQRSEELLTQAVGVAGLGIFEHDHHTDLVHGSARAWEICGLPEAAPVSASALFARIHPEDAPEILAAIRRAHDPTGEGLFAAEYRFIRPDGQVRWVNARSRTFFSDEGDLRWPVRTVGAILDVTERKQGEMDLQRTKAQLESMNTELEERVQERTARLREMVVELEHMSYSMVHDMRAPLRAIHGFATLIERGEGAQLSADSRELLSRIVAATGQMDHLVTDALNYGKVVREELALAPVEAFELLRGVMASGPEFQEPQAEIHLEARPCRVWANEAGLAQCCSELLRNAVKFVAPGVKPRVRVWAEEVRSAERGVRNATGDEGPAQTAAAGGEASFTHHASRITSSTPPSAFRSAQWRVRLWFEDNGTGLPREGLHKIFDMFQRMHRTEDYPGTGIGLALVRKVIERMGGQVGVESEEGRGSRFWLELPRAD